MLPLKPVCTSILAGVKPFRSTSHEVYNTSYPQLSLKMDSKDFYKSSYQDIKICFMSCFYFMYMHVLPTCLCMTHTQCSRSIQNITGQEESVRSPGPGLADGWELPCGCWELNSGPLQVYQVFFITEPALRPLRVRV